ncbi:MAG: hypothetical protein ABJN26_16395 [Stappiaceae bacterium]
MTAISQVAKCTLVALSLTVAGSALASDYRYKYSRSNPNIHGRIVDGSPQDLPREIGNGVIEYHAWYMRNTFRPSYENGVRVWIGVQPVYESPQVNYAPAPQGRPGRYYPNR